MPTVAWCEHGPGCPEHTIRADYPVTPQAAELDEITLTQGGDAAVIRSRQMDRNWERRQISTNRQRYIRIAMQRNMRIAADRLAERARQDESVSGPQLPDAGSCGNIAGLAKKPPVAAAPSETIAAQEVEIA
jgi:hypothetical protein